MFLTNYVKLGVLAIIVLLLSLAGYKLYHNGYEAGKAEVQAKWDAQKLIDASTVITVIETERLKQKQLQTNLDLQRVDYEKSVKASNAKYASLVNSLRERAERPTSSASDQGKAGGATTATNGSCTGLQLYRQDGEFLAGFARDSETVRLDLLSCVQQYNLVRTSINSE